jgi:hypothetical protein
MRRVGLGSLVAAAAGVAGCRLGSPNDLVDTLPANSGNLGALVALTGKECATAYTPSTFGHVVYSASSLGGVFRVAATPGSDVENLSVELDRVSKGTDEWVNQSADGQWLLVGTSRFGCAPNLCAALVSADACSGQAIVDGAGNPVEPSEWSAVGTQSNGDVVIAYGLSSVGPHPVDLYSMTRHDGAWNVGVLLTGSSPYPYHGYPVFSADGTTLLMDCGTNSYLGGKGTSVCQVATDGTRFEVVRAPGDGPPGEGSWPLHKANYAPDGSIVFEGEWPNGNERIWQYPAGTSTPALVNTPPACSPTAASRPCGSSAPATRRAITRSR